MGKDCDFALTIQPEFLRKAFYNIILKFHIMHHIISYTSTMRFVSNCFSQTSPELDPEM